MEQVKMKGLKQMCCISLLVPLTSTSMIFLSFYVQRRDLTISFQQTSRCSNHNHSVTGRKRGKAKHSKNSMGNY